MKDNISSEVEQRVRRYWYIDGFGELVGGGGMCLILALYFAAVEYFGDESAVGGILNGIMALVLIGGIFLVRQLVNAVKRRVTYPRTGYVEYFEPKSKVVKSILSAVVGILLAMTVIFIVRQFNRIDTMVGLSGLVMGIILFAKQVWTVQVKRFYILSLASIFYGSILAVSGLSRGNNLALFYGLMSFSFAVSGGLTLKKYLNENPLPTEI